MAIESRRALRLIYFSPTGTTRTVLEAIAEGFVTQRIEHYDLTRATQRSAHFREGVAIIGIPVYAGRVPEVCLARLAGFTAAGVPAVLVALYGNREYEDALVELRDVATQAGFSAVAAGAFIGEHSYSTAAQPIAAGRPDAADLAIARQFGRDVARKLDSEDHPATPAFPGNVPYRDRLPLGGIAPETNSACTLCGICADVCPTFVIQVESEVITQADDCIMCCACVKQCPVQARELNHPVIRERRNMLFGNFSRRKEPELFL